MVEWFTKNEYGGEQLSDVEVKKLFDKAFSEITKKLIALDLKKTGDEREKEEQSLLNRGCRELIETNGSMNSVVVCQFSEDLYRYITTKMNGGKLPSEEELHLYLNEYMNIICGFAVSQMNNVTGTKSRLSVPRFFQEGEKIDVSLQKKQRQKMTYQSKYGMLHVFLFYSFQND